MIIIFFCRLYGLEPESRGFWVEHTLGTAHPQRNIYSPSTLMQVKTMTGTHNFSWADCFTLKVIKFFLVYSRGLCLLKRRVYSFDKTLQHAVIYGQRIIPISLFPFRFFGLLLCLERKKKKKKIFLLKSYKIKSRTVSRVGLLEISARAIFNEDSADRKIRNKAKWKLKILLRLHSYFPNGSADREIIKLTWDIFEKRTKNMPFDFPQRSGNSYDDRSKKWVVRAPNKKEKQ